MKLTVRGHNLKITPAIRSHAEKKFAKYGGLFSEVILADLNLEVKRIKNRDRAHVAAVTLQLPQKIILRAEARTGDIYVSIDELVAKLDAPLKKYQDRLKNDRRKRSFAAPVPRLAEPPERGGDEETLKIVPEPKAAPKPMDPIEAALQLNKTRERFYVFNNSRAAHIISVVYARRNNTYALLTFKKLYLKRAKLRRFKATPSSVKYEGGGVKITKITDIVSAAKPLSARAAALRLGKSRRDEFLPFLNIETERVNVLYKKKQPNHFGLIEPSM
ncbi:ribosomal subunit interface protein [Candidatus Termititenax persephonae]|uniref:Ribosomal subunit interface protein n=1 Tax=Candidatus Termititenax persephonae TaxID=2218525 RepID=A0A388THV8_9BACT|nr:ribosomal subunit interface protein [Candidatus Termititenax persephonae]